MKKIITVLTILTIFGCSTREPLNQLSTPTTIQEVVDQLNETFSDLSPEEIAHLDSLQNYDAYQVGNAERNLDTIINHIRVQFRTDVPGTMY